MKTVKKILCILFTLAMLPVLMGAAKAQRVYDNAQDALVDGEYQKAADLFDSISNYEDASVLAIYCKAMVMGESGKYSEAAQSFEFLNDFKDSSYLCVYFNACDLEERAKVNHKLYIDASREFSKIALYKDSNIRAEECLKELFMEADSAGQSGDYALAISLFSLLEDYNNSSCYIEYYDACRIRDAAELSPNKYADASDKFKALTGFRDSNEQAESCLESLYLLARANIETQTVDLDEYYDNCCTAYEYFNSLKNRGYKDSSEYCSECIYLQAELLCNMMKFQKAEEKYMVISGYKDSNEMADRMRVLQNIKVTIEYYVANADELDEMLPYNGNYLYPDDLEENQVLVQRFKIQNNNQFAIDVYVSEIIDDQTYTWKDPFHIPSDNYHRFVLTSDRNTEIAESGRHTFEIYLDAIKVYSSSFDCNEGLSREKEKNVEVARNLSLKATIGIYDTKKEEYVKTVIGNPIKYTLEENQIFVPRIGVTNNSNEKVNFNLVVNEEDGTWIYWNNFELSPDASRGFFSIHQMLNNNGSTNIKCFIGSTFAGELCFSTMNEDESSDLGEFVPNSELYGESLRSECMISKKENGAKASFENVMVGDILLFGHYEQDNEQNNGKEMIEWKVLDKKDGKILLLSVNALDCVSFHFAPQITSWDNCTLHSWLNGSFSDTAFTASELNLIEKTPISPDANSVYNTDQGKQIMDKIFLLSEKETEKYIKSTSDSSCQPTKYAKSIGTELNVKGAEIWLRTMGAHRSYAEVFEEGETNTYGVSVFALAYVQPAIWIRLT